MGYWKDKVIPNFKKVFDKSGIKKAAAADATKLFNDSKEQYATEIEDKKTELEPKLIEIYEASPIKSLVKEPKDAGIKKQSAAVQKFLEDLAKIEFPGAQAVSELASKFGPAYVSEPIHFLFEKVSAFIPAEEKKEEAPAAATPEGTAVEEVTSKDIVVEEAKKEGETTEAAEAATTVAEPTEPSPAAKAEEPPAVVVAAPAP